MEGPQLTGLLAHGLSKAHPFICVALAVAFARLLQVGWNKGDEDFPLRKG